MAYLGTSPSNGVRRRFVYTATANQTSFSGNDDNATSLVYVDVAYLDVYQNGVKLKSVSDYASTTGTSVVLVQGASADDVVEIISFDVFSIGDTVSAADGGSFAGNIGMGGTLSVTGVLTGTSLDISGNIDIDGTTNLDVVDIDGAVNMAAVLTANGGVVFNEGSADVDFRVETNGDANMFIVDGGNDQVMIGTNTVVANSTLHIAGPLKTANAGATVPNNNFNVFSEAGNNTYNSIFENQASTTNSQYMISLRFTAASTDNNAALFLDCRDATTQRLSISSDGDVKNHDNSYGAISDLKLKEQITDASEQWDDIKALKIRKYKFKTDVATGDSDSHWRLGVIAQEVETAGMSGLVKNEADLQEIDGINSETGTTTKSVKYSILYMKAVKALQEAMTRIETLESKVTALENA